MTKKLEKITAEKKIIYIKNKSWSGSTGPIEYGSNPDPDPKPCLSTNIYTPLVISRKDKKKQLTQTGIKPQ